MPQTSPPATIRLFCFAASLPPEVCKGYFPEAEARGQVKDPRAVLRYAQHYGALQQLLVAPDVYVPSQGLPDALVPHAEPSLRDRCHGVWHGQNLRAVPPEQLARYVREEGFAPAKGETGQQFQTRIGGWLAKASLHGCTLVIARPPVVRALMVQVLGGQSAMTHHLDSEPETMSLLTCHAGRWRVRQYGARVV